MVLKLGCPHSPKDVTPVSLPVPPHYLFMYFLRGEYVAADSFKFLVASRERGEFTLHGNMDWLCRNGNEQEREAEM